MTVKNNIRKKSIKPQRRGLHGGRLEALRDPLGVDLEVKALFKSEWVRPGLACGGAEHQARVFSTSSVPMGSACK